MPEFDTVRFMSGISRHFARRAVALVLMLAIGLVPTLPVFATPVQTDDTSYAVHAGASATDRHAGHDKTVKADDTAGNKASSCDRHDHGSGNCCATCAQCFTATSAMPAMLLTIHFPRLSAVPHLHDRLVVAAHNRPPAI